MSRHANQGLDLHDDPCFIIRNTSALRVKEQMFTGANFSLLPQQYFFINHRASIRASHHIKPRMSKMKRQFQGAGWRAGNVRLPVEYFSADICHSDFEQLICRPVVKVKPHRLTCIQRVSQNIYVGMRRLQAYHPYIRIGEFAI